MKNTNVAIKAAKANPVAVAKAIESNAKSFTKPNKVITEAIAEAKEFSATAKDLINHAVKAFDKADKKGLDLAKAWLDAGMYVQQISELCEGNTKKVKALLEGTKLEQVSRQDRNDAAYLYLHETLLLDAIKAGTIKAGGANHMRKQLKKLMEPTPVEAVAEGEASDATEATIKDSPQVTAQSIATRVASELFKHGISLKAFEAELIKAMQDID